MYLSVNENEIRNKKKKKIRVKQTLQNALFKKLTISYFPCFLMLQNIIDNPFSFKLRYPQFGKHFIEWVLVKM